MVASGLGRVDAVSKDKLPRLADFVHWVTACETGLGCEAGSFLKVYNENLNEGQLEILSADLITGALRGFVDAHPWTIDDKKNNPHPNEWEGTAENLLTYLCQSITDDERRDARARWPATPKVLSGRIRRAAPGLRKVGIDCTDRRSNGVKLWKIKKGR